MQSKRSSSLPLLFRAAAFYAFFSIFFSNAQQFVADWDNPLGSFIQNVYNVFSPSDAVHKSNGQVTPNGVTLDPVPPPPPPPKP